MKSTILSILLLTSSITFAGGRDSGGGDAHQSTRKDLQDVLHDMNNISWTLTDDYLVGRPFNVTTIPLKQDLARIANKIFGRPYYSPDRALGNYIANLKYEIKDQCFEGNVEKDASTLFQKNAAVCLNASKLSRFPKSVLKDALLPIIFHEVGHQYGLNEAEADALQDLVELNLKYRNMYIEAMRTRVMCAFASDTLDMAQKNEVLKYVQKMGWNTGLTQFPKFTPEEKLKLLVGCVAHSVEAGSDLKAKYGPYPAVDLKNILLLPKEKQALMRYDGGDETTIFRGLTKALREPSISGYTSEVLESLKIDPANMMMIGGKALLIVIDQEVGQKQNLIEVK